MDNQNEYERLKAEGYTEEEIKVALDSLSQLSISQEPLGEKRDDRGVVATDASGVTMKTSSIMMGYNKQNIQLENGEYVSYEEFRTALMESMAKDEQNTVYVCKKTGKKVDSSLLSEEMLQQIISETTSLRLSETDKITNQTAAKIEINEPKLKKIFSKGILMLGNIGLKLPNGEYVNAKEIEKALEDYIKLSPEKITITTKPSVKVIDHYEVEDRKTEYRRSDLYLKSKYNISDEGNIHEDDIIAEEHIINENDNKFEEVFYKVIKRYKKVVSKEFLALVAAIMLFLSMLKINNVSVINEKIENNSVIPYSISRIAEANENYLNSMIEFSTGEKVELENGTEFYASSDHAYGGDATKGIIGEGIRSEGEYTAEFFSFLHNGNIIAVQMNNNEDLQENMERVAKENNVSIDEIEVHVHFGGPVCGWVNFDDIVNNVSSDQVQIESTTYNGVVNNFNGESITINTEKGPVSIGILDENGDLLKAGSVVKGSDGNDYQIDALSLDDIAITSNDISIEKELTFNIKNISLNDVIMTSLATALASLIVRKKKKVMTEMTEEQILDLIEEARSEYDDDSEFSKAISTIIDNKDIGDKSSIDVLKQALIDQETTVEDIKNIGGSKI